MNTHLILGLIGAGSELFDWAGLGYSKPGVRNGEIGLPPLSENATENGDKNHEATECHWQLDAGALARGPKRRL